MLLSVTWSNPPPQLAGNTISATRLKTVGVIFETQASNSAAENTRGSRPIAFNGVLRFYYSKITNFLKLNFYLFDRVNFCA